MLIILAQTFTAASVSPSAGVSEQIAQALGAMLVLMLGALVQAVRGWLAARAVASTVAQGVEAGEVRVQAAVQAEFAKLLGAKAAGETSLRLAKITKQAIAAVAEETGVAEAVAKLAKSDDVAGAKRAALKATSAARPALGDEPENGA